MKLRFIVLFSISIIFFIRLLWSESINIFNKNFDLLFNIQVDKFMIYIYQALVIIYISFIKKNNYIILSILLILNIFLIIMYLYDFSSVSGV